MRPLDLTRRGVLGTVAVLVVVGVCIRLGVWQLDRRAEVAATNAAIAQRMAEPPIELTRAPRDTAGLVYRRARVSGPVDDDRAIVLAGRSRNGAPGVNVLSPVRPGPGAVLVNRGWLPSPDAATIDLDAVRLRGTLRAEGVLLPFPDVDLGREADGFQVTWFRLDGRALRDQFPYPVAPLYLAATAVSGAAPRVTTGAVGADDEGPATVVAPALLDPPTLDPGPHLSYAIQWFSFAAIFLIGWIVILVGRPSRG